MIRIVYEASDSSKNIIKRTFVGTQEEFQKFVKQKQFLYILPTRGGDKIKKGDFRDNDLRKLF